MQQEIKHFLEKAKKLEGQCKDWMEHQTITDVDKIDDLKDENLIFYQEELDGYSIYSITTFKIYRFKYITNEAKAYREELKEILENNKQEIIKELENQKQWVVQALNSVREEIQKTLNVKIKEIKLKP